MEVTNVHTVERIANKKPSSHWVVECLVPRDVKSEWKAFKKWTVTSPDPCEFTYSLKINATGGLDILIAKKNIKPAKASITVTFIDVSLDKTSTLHDWTEEYCFHNIVPPNVLQEMRRIHIMVLNVWYGFKDEILPPPLISSSPGFDYFFMNEELSDFKLIIGEETLPVHKFLLAASSHEFLKMFVTPMKESKENRVLINDVELPVMKEVLRYIYTKETTAMNDVHMALAMLAVAEKYNLESLKYMCQIHLCKQLSIENALLILDVADMYNAPNLKSFTIKFLFKNKKEIVNTVEFKELYHRKPELLFDFITIVLND
ncbi:uncharacterized protein LOC135160493 [Diachasmimorpha longicaudata]|uniref:uncharacterized protein LOC135160493 n=1 Tax=Diachasmimorpha longicaudata TaxID=58733 RepID=UPI0030B8E11B